MNTVACDWDVGDTQAASEVGYRYPTDPLHIVTMHGLGDNLYHRPFVRAAAARRCVYLETPWPEVYADLPVRFVRPAQTKLRTQAKNVARQRESRWTEAEGETLVFRYASQELARGSIADAMELVVPLGGAPFVFDLPDFGPSPVRVDKPLAVLRPATVRSEWPNPARNPRPEYLFEAAEYLRGAGYHVVSVADLEPDREWLIGEPPPADTTLHAGELDVSALLALVQCADLCVGGVGWLAPACLAARTPLVVVGGGEGGFNAPEKITDPRMDLSRVRWLLPDLYCRCKERSHECEKGISDFRTRFARTCREVTS